MNRFLLNTDIQNYINLHLNENINNLIFQKSPFDSVSMQEIVQQIDGKKRLESKLPTWFEQLKIYYPPKLNLEQCSSELTAKFKSSLVTGDSLLDLTMGFGVDSYYFSKNFKQVVGCEVDSGLYDIVRNNYKQLEVMNVEVLNTSAESFLAESDKTFDVIYIDPARRNDANKKMVGLSDCVPKVIELMPKIWERTTRVLIKTSPLLDITEVIRELNGVSEIYCISVDNDMKELLFLVEKNFNDEPKIIAKDLSRNSNLQLSFSPSEEFNCQPKLGLAETFLYEPNSALMKSGGFKIISEKWNLRKLHINSHLYTNSENIDFPGRKFQIQKVLPFNKKLLKGHLPAKANVTTRNFPISVKEIRNAFNIKDGGDSYLFFTTDVNEQKVVLFAKKL